MTSFAVNHGGMNDVNDGLNGSLQQMRAILGQLDNAMKIRETRRDIARVKSVLRERTTQAPAAQGR